MNGIQSVAKDLLVVVSGAVLNRDMTEVVLGSTGRTCALPPTAVIVRPHAFYKNESIASVRLNEGLKTLEEHCFQHSGIRGLVLPASVIEVSEWAFAVCMRLRHADLSAARGLKSLGKDAFSHCSRLRQVLLNDGLETICPRCFSGSGVERVAFPRTLRRVEDGTFAYCQSLKQVDSADSALESVDVSAFCDSGLESFTAPPSLRTIGKDAFSGCKSLKHVDLSGM